MKIVTDYYVLQKTKDGELLILQENVETFQGEKVDQTLYFYDVLGLYHLDDILLKIREREKQLKQYQTIQKDLLTEHLGYYMKENFIFMNGNVMEGAMIDFNSDDADARYCFSLELDDQQVTVWKRAKGEHFHSYRNEYFDAIVEGIGKLFVTIEKYALKSLV